MLTDENLELERPHISGVQRLYKFTNGYGLSVVNATELHSFKFRWEIAVLDPKGTLTYDTVLTDDVEVFYTDEEANAFIQRAALLFNEGA